MYSVDVDLVLRYVPPMSDNGGGIRLTRSFDLPFPPSEDVSVFSKEWEGMEEPMGYRLKEITWDLDRKRFLAETELSVGGTPIALIPCEIKYLVDRGWQFGSYQLQYRTEHIRGRKRRKLPAIRASDWDYDEAANWDESVRHKDRPKEFKHILHAIVSTMVALRNNCSIAYAMLKTGGYVDVPEESLPRDLPAFAKQFSAAVREYESM